MYQRDSLPVKNGSTTLSLYIEKNCAGKRDVLLHHRACQVKQTIFLRNPWALFRAFSENKLTNQE